ncbi:MAG: hypothetical protein Q8O57_00555, partial [Kiritimatiellota bacterium]|nr:hypothetical protein [Kiritimatiellota bacterium]
AILVDQNGNGIVDGIDFGMDGTVDYQMTEQSGGGGGGGGGDDDGPPVGRKLDTNADGIWDHTYMGHDLWDPPMTGMPPPGSLVDMNGDNVADAILVDQNGNGLIDGIDIGMDGTVDGQITEQSGGGGGGGDDGPPVGTKLDTNADGTWDHTYLGNDLWDPPLTSMPPPGTLVDMNGDNVADAVLVDQNGNGIIDGIDIGMDGTVDGQITEG